MTESSVSSRGVYVGTIAPTQVGTIMVENPAISDGTTVQLYIMSDLDEPTKEWTARVGDTIEYDGWTLELTVIDKPDVLIVFTSPEGEVYD